MWMRDRDLSSSVAGCAVDSGITRKAFVGVALACLLVLAAGATALRQQLALCHAAHKALHHDAPGSWWADGVAEAGLQCRRYEKDVFLNLNDAGVRADYLRKWNEAWATLHYRLEQLRASALSDGERRPIDECDASARRYRQHFLEVADQIGQGRIARPEDANRAIAPFKEDFRQAIEKTQALAGEKLAEFGESGARLERSLFLGTIMTCLLVVLPSGVIIAGTWWLTRAILARNAMLARSEEKQRIFAERVDDIIWTCDMDLRWTYLSPSTERFRGYTAAEAMHQTLEEILTPASAAAAKNALASVLAAAAGDDSALDRSVRLELEHVCKDGSTKWAEVSASLVRGAEGRPASIVGISRDISERRAMQEAMAQAQQAAEAANRAKGEFLANMSHEIRTPMTAILGYIDVLSDYCARRCTLHHPEIGDPLSVISQNATHLLQIIDDVLDLSKIEAGKLAVERMRCSPCGIVAEVVSLMRVRAALKGLTLSIEFAGGMPESIESDPTRLRQILTNLVGNAIKFTEAGGVRLAASIQRGEDEKPLLQVQVIDTGLGMSAESLGRLFSPFVQADTSTSRKFGGAGLGLSISRRLARLLGGDISVNSAPGEGSVFTVSIPTGPLEGVRLLESPNEAEFQAGGRKSPPPPAPTVLEDRRVLLAEDGPDNQRLIAFLLRKAGAEVIVVDNGSAAIEAAAEAQRTGRPFDVLLLDMQMPVLDGYEAAKRLRAEGGPTPIIALTAHAMKEDRQKCLDAGCDDYIAKPIDRALLLKTVACHAGRGRHSPAAGLARSVP
jgi:PAS domain S-box-containing protein